MAFTCIIMRIITPATSLELFWEEMREVIQTPYEIDFLNLSGKFELVDGGAKAQFDLKIVNESIEVRRVNGQFVIHVIYKVAGKKVVDKTWTAGKARSSTISSVTQTYT